MHGAWLGDVGTSPSARTAQARLSPQRQGEAAGWRSSSTRHPAEPRTFRCVQAATFADAVVVRMTQRSIETVDERLSNFNDEAAASATGPTVTPNGQSRFGRHEQRDAVPVVMSVVVQKPHVAQLATRALRNDRYLSLLCLIGFGNAKE